MIFKVPSNLSEPSLEGTTRPQIPSLVSIIWSTHLHGEDTTILGYEGATEADPYGQAPLKGFGGVASLTGEGHCKDTVFALLLLVWGLFFGEVVMGALFIFPNLVSPGRCQCHRGDAGPFG